jgi:hypothetical protein
MRSSGIKISAKLLVLLLALGVFLVAALTLFLRGWVRDVILTPILFLLWLGGLLIRSTPQWVFWAVFLVLALLILANSLGTGKRRDQNVERAEPERPRRARVLFWAKHIQWRARRDFSPLGSAEPLRRLILEAMAFQERLSLTEVEQRLESGELDVPPVVRMCLQRRLAAEPAFPVSFWTRFRHRWYNLRQQVYALISSLTESRANTQPSPFESELESVAQFLEDRLGVVHHD